MQKSHPFQCLQIFGKRKIDLTFDKYLVAAAGPKIYSFNIRTGRLISEWPANDDDGDGDDGDDDDDDRQESSEQQRQLLEENEDALPGKRQKLSSSGPKSEDSSGAAEFVLERPEGRKRRVRPSEHPTVTKMVVTRNNRKLVVVTAEDKCVRVFDISTTGKLQQESERCMPKRPCSIALTPDDQTILCGDKFGDVYALPLYHDNSLQPESHADQQTPKTFKPSASELTVHTKGNRLALENQLRTGKRGPEKIQITFQHELLLGHVSLLTDLAYVSLASYQSPSGKDRQYILTADRDEHIRVSRGLPQAHITEAYCMGHTEFVSRLCVPSWKPEMLISGGGDSYLAVWQWIQARLVQKVDLSQHVQEYLAGHSGTKVRSSEGASGQAQSHLMETEQHGSHGEQPTIAVSGIWALSHGGGSDEGQVLVACEGIAALFCFTISSAAEMAPYCTIHLPGNVLDVAVLDQRHIIVSMDHIHEPNSRASSREEDQCGNSHLLAAFEFQPGPEVVWMPALAPFVNAICRHGFEARRHTDSFSETLYTIENLRKKGQGDME